MGIFDEVKDALGIDTPEEAQKAADKAAQEAADARKGGRGHPGQGRPAGRRGPTEGRRARAEGTRGGGEGEPHRVSARPAPAPEPAVAPEPSVAPAPEPAVAPEPSVAPAPDYTHSVPAGASEGADTSATVTGDAPEPEPSLVRHDDAERASRSAAPRAGPPRQPPGRPPRPRRGLPRLHGQAGRHALREIGERFGVDYHRIAQLNHVKNPDLIFPGQKFKIPND